MASGRYIYGIDELAKANYDLVNSAISVALVDTALYVVDLAADRTQEDIPEAAIIAQAVLTGKTVASGVFRANDVVFPNVTSDSNIGAFVLFVDNETLDTSVLVSYHDNASELPITPDGSDVTVVWDTGVNGIFKL